MSAQKTRRVFHYAEVLEGETHEPNGAGYTLSIQPTTGIIFTGYLKTPIEGDWVPVNRLPETTEPVPPAPRTRTRIVFEECDEADWKGDAMGRWWYRPKGAVKIVYSTYELSAEKGIVYFNRTEEVITDEPPERWNGYATAYNNGSDGTWYASVGVSDTTFSVDGIEHDTCEEANADIPSLKALAETYAARHGAVIEWEDAK